MLNKNMSREDLQNRLNENYISRAKALGKLAGLREMQEGTTMDSKEASMEEQELDAME